MDNSKLPVSRVALERVLARASQLQGATSDDPQHESLTEGQVLDLAKEVGLSPQHVRQALAEERARLTPDEPETGLAPRLFGPSRVSTQRVVRGTPARVLDVLDRWMQRDQWLRVIRQRSDMIVWEPRRGFFSNIRRTFGSGDYALFRANDIAATAVEVEGGQCLVRLEANFSSLRQDVGKQTVVGTAIGGAATAAAIVMNVMVPVAVVPVLVFGFGAFEQSRRTHKHATERALLTMQLLLDRIERGDSEPPSLIRMIESALPR